MTFVTPDRVDEWFWEDKGFGEKVDFETIRNLMIKDLSKG